MDLPTLGLCGPHSSCTQLVPPALSAIITIKELSLSSRSWCRQNYLQNVSCWITGAQRLKNPKVASSVEDNGILLRGKGRRWASCVIYYKTEVQTSRREISRHSAGLPKLGSAALPSDGERVPQAWPRNLGFGLMTDKTKWVWGFLLSRHICITGCHAALHGAASRTWMFYWTINSEFSAWIPCCLETKKAPRGAPESGFRIGEGKMFSFALSSFAPVLRLNIDHPLPRQHNYPYSGSFTQ